MAEVTTEKVLWYFFFGSLSSHYFSVFIAFWVTTGIGNFDVCHHSGMASLPKGDEEAKKKRICFLGISGVQKV